MTKGFTLLEVMLAIVVITLVMGGTFALVWQTTALSNVSSSRLTASYLCQEGIEIVRHIRDGNWLHQRTVPGFAWDTGLLAGQWEVDYNDTVLSPFSNRYLLLAGQFFSYDSGIASSFRRKITIVSSVDMLKVSVEVSWLEKGNPLRVTAEEHLYNAISFH